MTIPRQASYALFISFAAFNIAQLLIHYGFNIRAYNFVPGECSVVTLSDEEIYASDFVTLSDRIIFPYISASKQTGFFTFESKNKSATKLDLADKSLQEFNPEGISEDTVEIISLAKDGNSLKHLSTIRSKKFIGIRDVAAIGKNKFFATSWTKEKNEFNRFLQEYFALSTGAVIFFDGTTTKYVDRKISSPYGIVYDNEQRYLYVASYSSESIIAYTVSESFSIKRNVEIKLNSSPTLLWQGIDGSLITPTHPIRYRSLFHRTNETGCLSPSLILRIHISFTFSNNTRIDGIYSNDGATISAATSVIVTGNTLLMSGENIPILSCKLQPYVSFSLS